MLLSVLLKYMVLYPDEPGFEETNKRKATTTFKDLKSATTAIPIRS